MSLSPEFEEVLSRIFDRLDLAFPELGLRRTSRGWEATHREATKARFDARPDRVVCNQPGGFLIHGGDWVPWVQRGLRGWDYVEAVKALAHRAGVDCSPLEREFSPEDQVRQRRGDLLEDFARLTHEALMGPAGEGARAYLMGRTFAEEELKGLPFGFYATREAVSAALEAKGYSGEEVKASGVLSDGRWTGRLLIPWRDARGRVATVAARDLTGEAEEGAKYLYLSGGTKPPAFGLEAVDRRRGLVIVEGLLDVLLLRARGVENVVALGGTGRLLTVDRWGQLNAPSFTLALDLDKPGRDGTQKALENLRNVPNVPNVSVITPEALEGCKDPDELVRTRGVEAFRKALEKALPWSLYRGAEILEHVTPESEALSRREAVEKVLELAAGLPPLDVEDLLPLLSDRTGYSLETLGGMEREARERRDREKLAQEIKATSRALASSLEKPEADLLEVAATFSAKLARTQLRGEPPPPAFSVDALVRELRTTPEGLVSGWGALDALGVRFQPKELAVIGGRTGHGKTATLTNLYCGWIDSTEGALIYFSHEEPAELILCRLAALLSGGWSFAEVRDYLRDPYSRGVEYGWPDPEALRLALDRLRDVEGRLHLIHRPDWNVSRLAAYAREIAEAQPVAAVFVDYLQRVPAPEGKTDRRDQEVSAIGRALKALAVDLAVPVIAGAQINREAIPDRYQAGFQKALKTGLAEAVAYLRTARPDLHNLREGGCEQEADLVLGLMNYAADFRAEAGETNRTNLYEVGVLKNRYGEVGKWAGLAFDGAAGLIRDRKPGEGKV